MVAVNTTPINGTRGIEVGTNIYNDISIDTVWNLAGAPYKIRDNVTVLDGVTLTIEPEVEVLFENVSLSVDGTLKAVGGPFTRIIFRPVSDLPSSGEWRGIWFMMNSTDCVMDWVHISYAENAIKCLEGSSPTIINSRIDYSFYSGLDCGKNSTPTIKNCEIYASVYDGIFCNNYSNPIILGNKINKSLYGIVCYSSALIQDNEIDHCSTGIFCWNSTAHIYKNTIWQCIDGIFAFYSSPKIENNTITSCTLNGTRFLASNARVLNNTINHNGMGIDIPYDSRGLLANMRGNTVNGIDTRDLYYLGLKDETIENLWLDSGHSEKYYGSLTAQGSVTLYDCENITIRNCTVENTVNCIYAENSSFEIYTSILKESVRSDVYLGDNSWVRSYNGSVDENWVTIAGDTSYLVSYGDLQVTVRNYTEVPVADAVVEVRELNIVLHNTTTGDNGATPNLLVRCVRVSDSGTINYSVTVEVWSQDMTFGDNPRNIVVEDTNALIFTDLGDIVDPGILSNNIENGQQAVDVNTRITIAFTEPMNRTSVEDAFTISGNVTGQFVWEGNNLTFEPATRLAYLTTYTVSIGTGAKDIQGNNLDEMLAFSFTTQPEQKSVNYTMLIGVGILIIVLMAVMALFFIRRR